jgi:cyanophycin synthetase
VPAPGRSVVLRGIANVSRGGVYEDVSDRVHPDNRDMAERIAAALRMDALGVDFITTDISRSWREIGGAIIEVNETPAAGTPHYVDLVLRAMFPDQTRTRIPYVLFANDPQGVAAATWLGRAGAAGRTVGVVSASSTVVNGRPRGRAGQSLNDRVQSLTIDPLVEIIAVQATGEELEREGLLLDRIDHAFIGPGLSAEIEQLIRRHAARVSAIPAAGPGTSAARP